MRRLIVVLALIASAFAAAGSAVAANTAWQIVQTAGEVSVTTGGFFPVSVDPKAPLPDGAVVATGASGRAILRRGAEQIALDPLSRIVLAADADLTTRIRQDAGSAVFNIGKRRAPHFEVGTPFLAAIVKGTAFRVTVARDGAAVYVSEGAVEVATRFRTAVTLARPGMTAVVHTDGKAQIQLMENGHRTRTVTKDEGGWHVPAPATDIDSNHAASGTFNNDIEVASADAGVGGSASLLRTSMSFGVVPDLPIQPRQAGAAPTRQPALPRDGATLSVKGPALLAASPSTVGKATQRPHRTKHPRKAAAKSELPLLEISLCFLALLVFMFASHARGLTRQAKPVRDAASVVRIDRR
jgi:hypothetical protein